MSGTVALNAAEALVAALAASISGFVVHTFDRAAASLQHHVSCNCNLQQTSLLLTDNAAGSMLHHVSAGDQDRRRPLIGLLVLGDQMQ